jgi:nitronate monooxygenase
MSWTHTALTELVGTRLPIVQAPMAGGISTPRLAAAVSEAGGLGSIAGALLSPDDLRAEIAETRSLTRKPFAVNVFAPLPMPTLERIEEWARVTGTAPTLPPPPSWSFEDQLAVLAAEGVPVVSFTFGIPPLDGYSGVTIGTASSVDEARALEEAGIDAVVAQGFEAGGHRGTFLGPPERALTGTLALVPQIVDAVDIPVLAAGGIADGRGIAAALSLGADGVQLGTAFIRCPESDASDEHRAALAQATTISRVWTGRHARGVHSAAVDELEESGLEPPDYPIPRFFFPGPMHLAGQGGPLTRALPASELVQTLEAETDEAVAGLSG